MPGYRLAHIPNCGHTDVTRSLFRFAGQEFEEVTVGSRDWVQLISKSPCGQLPLLEDDGKIVCGSAAINRYLAKQFDYAGKTDWEGAQIDMVVNCLEDFTKLGFHVSREPDEGVKEHLQSKYADQIPVFMQSFESMLAENPRGYFVGDQMTLADLSFAEMVLWPEPLSGITVDLTDYPLCRALRDRVHSDHVLGAHGAVSTESKL